MTTYNISKTFPCHALNRMVQGHALNRMVQGQGQVTDKVAGVCRLSQRTTKHECRLDVNDGDIVYITGPSGAGKSVLLKELEKSIPATQRVNLVQIKLPKDVALVDCIDKDLVTTLRLLGIAGLSDCFCILNQPGNLSDGQKYRFRLAMALAAKKKFVFADEFCSTLDRITAAVICYNVHKFAKQTGTTFILASSYDDILLDLSPDCLVVKELSGPAQVIYKNLERQT